MVHGKRIQVSLNTSDYGEAVVKALEIRADPFLSVADPLRAEIGTISSPRQPWRARADSSWRAKLSSQRLAPAIAGRPLYIFSWPQQRFG